MSLRRSKMGLLLLRARAGKRLKERIRSRVGNLKRLKAVRVR